MSQIEGAWENLRRLGSTPVASTTHVVVLMRNMRIFATADRFLMKILSVRAQRNYDNPHVNPDGHWVELVFQNDYGTHTLEMNGRRLLPQDPALRRDLQWLLWDYGLLSQQDSRTARQRVRVAQELANRDQLNYRLARAYMDRLGAPER